MVIECTYKHFLYTFTEVWTSNVLAMLIYTTLLQLLKDIFNLNAKCNYDTWWLCNKGQLIKCQSWELPIECKKSRCLTLKTSYLWHRKGTLTWSGKKTYNKGVFENDWWVWFVPYWQHKRNKKHLNSLMGAAIAVWQRPPTKKSTGTVTSLCHGYFWSSFL